MAQDYKHHKPKPGTRRVAPGWMWFLIGLLVGLFIAFLVYLRVYPVGGLVSISPPTIQETTKPEQKQVSRSEQSPAIRKPRFEFYTILPEMEVPVPESELPLRKKAPPPRMDTSATYLLQVGSFRSKEEADRLKARLILMGLDVDIQTVAIDGQATWHRVRVGPFSELAKLDAARRRLAKQGMEAMVLKVKS